MGLFRRRRSEFVGLTAEDRQVMTLLVEAGADVVKVGVGAGSICTTRVVAGAGMPQLTAVHECAVEAAKTSTPVIADGGLTTSGDVVKAFVAGAHAVMVGNLLAGTDEAPGDLELVEGAMWKVYRGMGSASAMRGRASDRYQSGAGEGSGKHVAEGVEARVRYAGALAELVGQLVGGLRSGMGYAGAGTLDDLRARTRLVRITGAGLRFRQRSPQLVGFGRQCLMVCPQRCKLGVEDRGGLAPLGREHRGRRGRRRGAADGHLGPDRDPDAPPPAPRPARVARRPDRAGDPRCHRRRAQDPRGHDLRGVGRPRRHG